MQNLTIRIDAMSAGEKVMGEGKAEGSNVWME